MPKICITRAKAKAETEEGRRSDVSKSKTETRLRFVQEKCDANNSIR